MMRNYSILLLIMLVISLYPHRLFAQEKQLDFEQLSIQQGLAQASITYIHQDRAGFLWFGTLDGLNRYDGYNFITYHHIPYDTSFLSSPIISCILEDRAGNLWIGTQNGGLNKIDKFTKKITRYIFNPENKNGISSNIISSLAEDHDGNIWIGTSDCGLNRFDVGKNRFTHFRTMINNPDYISSDNVSSLIVDKSGILWVGTLGGGLNKYENGKFYHFKNDPKNAYSLNSNFITYLHYDRNGEIWIGTSINGINRFNPSGNRFINNSNEIKFGYEIGTGSVNSILLDSEGLLWVGTSNGLYYSDTSNRNFYLVQRNLGNPNSISDINILSIYEDRSGILWIGTLNKLNKFVRSRNRFSHYRRIFNEVNCLNDNMIRSIYKDKNNIIWIGTQFGGLNKFDRKNNKFSHFTANISNKFSLRSNYISCIFEDKDENLWVATMGGGFGIFDKKSDKFFLSENYKKYPNLPYFVFNMSIDNKGDYWLATNNGLYWINNQKKELKIFRHSWYDSTSISDNNIYTIFEDKEGTIWVGTWNGLNKFNRETENFSRLRHSPMDINSISNDLILNIYEDEEGYLWISTYGGGFNKYDRKKNLFKHYTINEGLPNNSAYCTLPDNIGNLWISSNRGLSKFNIKTEKIKTYDLNDGLQELEYNGKVFFRADDGELFFGGINGFNCFFPEKLKENYFIPNIVIVDIKKYGESIATEKNISELKEIKLSYTENNFTIEFVSLAFFNPQKNKYAYILEGLDKNIQYCGTRHFVNYTNLEPGEYTFKVFGSNGDDLWNFDGTSLKIIILPPLWKTWWAYIIYSFFVVLTFFLFYKTMVNKHKKRDEARLKEEQEKRVLLETQLRISNIELEAEAARSKAIAAEFQANLIKSENERNALELEEARKLQISMLPKIIPEIPYLDISVYMKTATEVGGDYYDFLVNDDNSLVIALGDATGHGMKAGMMVSIIKSLFYSGILKDDINRFYNECSNIIRKMNIWNLYMGLSLIKIENNRMKICSAGMPPSYIYRSKEDLIEEIRFSSMPLGAVSSFSYDEKVFDIQSGDTILFLTDGLPEQFNDKKEILDYDIIKSEFYRISKFQPQEIIDSLLLLSEKWSNGKPQNDDITLIVLKVK